MFKFEMKERVEDNVTTMTGVVTARVEYLTSENRYLVEGVDSTGRPIEWWIDENRLVSKE